MHVVACSVNMSAFVLFVCCLFSFRVFVRFVCLVCSFVVVFDYVFVCLLAWFAALASTRRPRFRFEQH